MNAFVRLGALIDALERVNKGKVLQDVGLSIGAIVVDSCSSDLRTVADLYELFFGTNIEKLVTASCFIAFFFFVTTS